MIEIIKDKKDIEAYYDMLNKRGAMNGGKFLPIVQEIIADVIKNGDDALVKYTKKFDDSNFDIKNIEITKEEQEKAFLSLINKAHRLQMKVIVDSLSRISSSRAHRKYRSILLRYLDSQGKMQICYGSDGKSVRYEDSAILNYRKKESWDMLIAEMKILIEKFKIDGVHIDNCQAWPQIM